MELSLPHTLHLFNIFREYDGKVNCAKVLEEECIRMFGTKYLNDEHDCNVVSMNSLNTHDANDMQSHKLGDAMFDEYDIFCPPSFYEQIYYDESVPPIYADYIDESGLGEVVTLFSDESTISEEVPIDYKNKVATMMIIVMTCMLLRIMITMKLFIIILICNWIVPHMTVILLSLLLLFRMRRILLMWRVVKFICL